MKHFDRVPHQKFKTYFGINIIAVQKDIILITITTTIFIAILLADITNVLSMHWSWLDSQNIVGGQLWPPESDVIRRHASAGRDWTGFGAFSHLLSLIVPIDNNVGMKWHYIVNYSFHFANLVMSGMIVRTVTYNHVLALMTMIVLALASSGPEVYLNLLHSELQGTFWVLCVCQLLILDIQSGISYWYCRRFAWVIMFSCGFLATGFLGKEPLLLFWIALIGTLIVLSLLRVRLGGLGEQDILDSVTSSCGGVIAYWIYRGAVGVANPLTGSYSSTFLQVPVIERIAHHFMIYTAYCQDIFIIIAVAIFLMTLLIASRDTSDFQFSRQEYIACSLIIFSNLYLFFHIILVVAVQFYYLYPVSFGATIGGVILLRSRVVFTALRGKFTQTIILGGFAYSVIVGATHWYSRSTSIVMVTSAVRALLDNISGLPYNSLVLVPFAETDERVNNLPTLLRVLYGRPDLQFIAINEIDGFLKGGKLLNCDNVLGISLIKSPHNFLVGTRELTSWEASSLNGEIDEQRSLISSPRAAGMVSRQIWSARVIVLPSIVDALITNNTTWSIHISLGWLVSQFDPDNYCKISNNAVRGLKESE